MPSSHQRRSRLLVHLRAQSERKEQRKRTENLVLLRRLRTLADKSIVLSPTASAQTLACLDALTGIERTKDAGQQSEQKRYIKKPELTEMLGQLQATKISGMTEVTRKGRGWGAQFLGTDSGSESTSHTSPGLVHRSSFSKALLTSGRPSGLIQPDARKASRPDYTSSSLRSSSMIVNISQPEPHLEFFHDDPSHSRYGNKDMILRPDYTSYPQREHTSITANTSRPNSLFGIFRDQSSYSRYGDQSIQLGSVIPPKRSMKKVSFVTSSNASLPEVGTLSLAEIPPHRHRYFLRRRLAKATTLALRPRGQDERIKDGIEALVECDEMLM